MFHNLPLFDVILVVVGLSASFAAAVKLELAKRADGRVSIFRLGFAAVALGFGVWSTQFISALGAGVLTHTRYNPLLTLLSLAVAMGGASLGLCLMLSGQARTRLQGGLVTGATMSLTPFVGLAAAEDAPFVIQVAPALLGAVAAVFFCIVSARLPRALSPHVRACRALLLFLAMISAHLAAASSVLVEAGPQEGLDAGSSFIGQLTALVSASVILMSIWAALREARRVALQTEAKHLRELANAAVEGLIICHDGEILATNMAFEAMVGVRAAAGGSIERFIDPCAVSRAMEALGASVESELVCADETIPVEIVASRVAFNGASRVALALRDLRGRREAEEKIRFLAHNDALTGLLNRAAFSQRLRGDLLRLRRANDMIVVLYLDLDRFKQVNDVLRHAAGDTVLQQVAGRVRTLLSAQDSFARLGGDEFAIALVSRSDLNSIRQLCDALIRAVGEPIALGDGRSALVGASLGVAIGPSDGDDASSLLAAADAALYQAKAAGRNTYRFYDPKLAEALTARRKLEQDLRAAMETQQLRVVYQPQARMRDRKIYGYEALVRWDHPEKGLIAPDAFIPIAEESGLIIPLGEWVLRQACAEAAAWDGAEILSVNVSPIQLHSDDLPRIVKQILSDTQLPPSRLQIEITETALIKNAVQALKVLRRLKSFGVSIALDDFGTGFSSLSNLRNFPIDTIKIDGCFVKGVNQDPQAATIVRAVLGLGGGLGLRVIAEGVETSAEEKFLVAEGCQHAQGYLYGRPGERRVKTLRLVHG